MKTIAVMMTALLVCGLSEASTMRPSMIVYGSVRDCYGTRMHEGVQISVYRGTNEMARTYAGTYPDGVNYRVSLDVYDPLTAPADKLKPGDTVEIRVKMGAAFQPLIGDTSVVISGQGEAMRVDLLMGVDSDGDGIPDAWEQMVIANSGGGASTLGDVGPGHDVDGDGMTDDQEFWYGSFAFLPGDQLQIDDFVQVGEGLFKFRFLTMPSAMYHLEASETPLTSPQWQLCPIALNETSTPAPVEFAGNGSFVSIYVEGVSQNVLYRLKAR